MHYIIEVCILKMEERIEERNRLDEVCTFLEETRDILEEDVALLRRRYDTLRSKYWEIKSLANIWRDKYMALEIEHTKLKQSVLCSQPWSDP